MLVYAGVLSNAFCSSCTLLAFSQKMRRKHAPCGAEGGAEDGASLRPTAPFIFCVRWWQRLQCAVITCGNANVLNLRIVVAETNYMLAVLAAQRAHAHLPRPTKLAVAMPPIARAGRRGCQNNLRCGRTGRLPTDRCCHGDVSSVPREQRQSRSRTGSHWKIRKDPLRALCLPAPATLHGKLFGAEIAEVLQTAHSHAIIAKRLREGSYGHVEIACNDDAPPPRFGGGVKALAEASCCAESAAPKCVAIF